MMKINKKRTGVAATLAVALLCCMLMLLPAGRTAQAASADALPEITMAELGIATDTDGVSVSGNSFSSGKSTLISYDKNSYILKFQVKFTAASQIALVYLNSNSSNGGSWETGIWFRIEQANGHVDSYDRTVANTNGFGARAYYPDGAFPLNEWCAIELSVSVADNQNVTATQKAGSGNVASYTWLAQSDGSNAKVLQNKDCIGTAVRFAGDGICFRDDFSDADKTFAESETFSVENLTGGATERELTATQAQANLNSALYANKMSFYFTITSDFDLGTGGAWVFNSCQLSTNAYDSAFLYFRQGCVRVCDTTNTVIKEIALNLQKNQRYKVESGVKVNGLIVYRYLKMDDELLYEGMYKMSVDLSTSPNRYAKIQSNSGITLKIESTSPPAFDTDVSGADKTVADANKISVESLGSHNRTVKNPSELRHSQNAATENQLSFYLTFDSNSAANGSLQVNQLSPSAWDGVYTVIYADRAEIRNMSMSSGNILLYTADVNFAADTRYLIVLTAKLQADGKMYYAFKVDDVIKAEGLYTPLAPPVAGKAIYTQLNRTGGAEVTVESTTPPAFDTDVSGADKTVAAANSYTISDFGVTESHHSGLNDAELRKSGSVEECRFVFLMRFDAQVSGQYVRLYQLSANAWENAASVVTIEQSGLITAGGETNDEKQTAAYDFQIGKYYLVESVVKMQTDGTVYRLLNISATTSLNDAETVFEHTYKPKTNGVYQAIYCSSAQGKDYARYTLKTYKAENEYRYVTFYDGNGNVTYSDITEKHIVLPASADAEGTLAGWTTDISGISNLYAPDSAYTLTEDTAFYPVSITFGVENGAAVRITSIGIGGIRFSVIIDCEDYDKLSEYVTQTGALIAPASAVRKGITADSVASVKDASMVTNHAALNKNGENYQYYGALLGLTSDKFATEYAAIGFITFEYSDGSTGYVYTPYNNQPRSAYGVANKYAELNTGSADKVAFYTYTAVEITYNGDGSADLETNIGADSWSLVTNGGGQTIKSITVSATDDCRIDIFGKVDTLTLNGVALGENAIVAFGDEEYRVYDYTSYYSATADTTTVSFRLTDVPVAEELADFILEQQAGKEFVILQLTDTQIIDYEQRTGADVNNVPSYYNKNNRDNYCFDVITKLVEEVQPDLIVMTGDNTFGRIDNDGSNFAALVKHVDSFGIPWAPIFGNHDMGTAKGVRWMCDIFEGKEFTLEDGSTYALKHCLFKRGDSEGYGNYTVGIKDESGRLVRMLYMIDCHGDYDASEKSLQEIAEDHGDEFDCNITGLWPKQKQWLGSVSSALVSAYGEEVPSLMFFHMPPADLYGRLFDKYDISDSEPADLTLIGKDGDFGYVANYYTMGSDSMPVSGDRGLTKDVLSACGVDGMFFGHEHTHGFSILSDGIRYTFGVKTGKYDSHRSHSMGGTVIKIEDGGCNFTVSPEYVTYWELVETQA